jgi:RimJ/RimL family protein N-acetyltransferase
MADRPPKVNVRPAEIGDADGIACWLNDPEVYRYLTSNLRHGGMTAALVRSGLRRPDQSWHVIEAEGEGGARPIGLIAFDTVDGEDGVANMWYLIGEGEFRGRGVAAEAITRLLDENPLGLVTVTAWVGEPNTASIHCLEKAGFRTVGRVTAAYHVEGRRYDRVLFEKLLARE